MDADSTYIFCANVYDCETFGLVWPVCKSHLTNCMNRSSKILDQGSIYSTAARRGSFCSAQRMSFSLLLSLLAYKVFIDIRAFRLYNDQTYLVYNITCADDAISVLPVTYCSTLPLLIMYAVMNVTIMPRCNSVFQR